MIADSSLSSAFDDLADLFLGGGMEGVPPAAHGAGCVESGSAGSEGGSRPKDPKPLLVEGLVLGHLPMLASLWASQYPRMAAATDNAAVALVRLDAGTARVEIFHPPHAAATPSRLGKHGENAASTRPHGLPDRPCPDLAGAISRAAQVSSRVVIYSSLPADELLFARSGTISAMAVLTGADDASAVGAYKAIKRLAGSEHGGDARTKAIRIAVMGSDEGKASAAFHRLADAAGSFLSVPIQLAGHCRQIAGGVPGTILFEGPSAMTTQAVLESLARPGCTVTSSATSPGEAVHVEARQPVKSESIESECGLLPVEVADARGGLPMPELAAVTNVQPAQTVAHVETGASPVHTHVPSSLVSPPAVTMGQQTPPGLTPLPIRCPFDRSPVLAIDGAGVPQVIASALAGQSADAVQRLLSVAAWLWASRELLGMVCPSLRTDAKPVMHLVTDRPTDVKRLIDSDLHLHVRASSVLEAGTLALN